MELTGKAKKDFEKWYRNYIGNHKGRNLLIDGTYNSFFKKLPQSMQYGIFVDFFDSVGMMIELQVHVDPTMQGGCFKKFKAVILFKGRFVNVPNGYGKRYNARTEAIKKANELYNER